MIAVISDEPVLLRRSEQQSDQRGEQRGERRRSRRSSRCLDVIVCGDGRRAWQEQTCTLSLNGQGMLTALGTKVVMGEPVLVRDPENHIEREGRVVGLGRDYGRRREVAIEFTEPAPAFWLDDRRSGGFR